MSFILDALKKSESDRQRHSGPSLYEARVTTPRMGGLPPWAVAVVALLGVNLIVVGWMLLHRSRTAPPQQSVQASVPPTALPAWGQQAPAPGTVAQTVPPQAMQQERMQQQMVPQQMQMMPQQGVPPQGMYAQGMYRPGYPQQGMQYPQQGMQYPQQGMQYPQQGMQYPQQGMPMQAQQTMNQQPSQMNMQGAPGAAPQGNAGSQSQNSGNPDDYAPAVEPGGEDSLGGYVRRGTASGLPLYPDADAAPGAGLPVLHLDFHVYAANPQQRFVMINMHRLREGDELPDGVRLDSITPDGAVVSRGSSKYFLPRP